VTISGEKKQVVDRPINGPVLVGAKRGKSGGEDGQGKKLNAAAQNSQKGGKERKRNGLQGKKRGWNRQKGEIARETIRDGGTTAKRRGCGGQKKSAETAKRGGCEVAVERRGDRFLKAGWDLEGKRTGEGVDQRSSENVCQNPEEKALTKKKWPGEAWKKKGLKTGVLQPALGNKKGAANTLVLVWYRKAGNGKADRARGCLCKKRPTGGGYIKT